MPDCQTDSTDRIANRLLRADPSRFAKAFVIGLSGLLLGTALFNWTIDPIGLYDSKLIKPIVQTTRTEKLALLEEYDVAPEGLVLGSSRAMKFDPIYLQEKTGLSFFNAGVDYAKPEDWLAILRHYQAHFHQLPKVIILVFDPNSLSAEAPIEQELVQTPNLARYVPEAISWEDQLTRWKLLVSWHQTRLSLISLKHALQKRGDAEISQFFEPNGKIVYREREEQMQRGEYDFEGPLAYTQNEYRSIFQNFQHISPERCAAFADLASLCQSHGTRLLVIVPPLHPRLKQYLLANTHFQRVQERVLAYLAKTQRNFDFRWIDATDVESFQGDPKRFIDGIHPLESNTRLIVDRVFEDFSKNAPKNAL